MPSHLIEIHFTFYLIPLSLVASGLMPYALFCSAMPSSAR